MFETIHDLSQITGGATLDENGRSCTDPRGPKTPRDPFDGGTAGRIFGMTAGGSIGSILGGGRPGLPGPRNANDILGGPRIPR